MDNQVAEKNSADKFEMILRSAMEFPGVRIERSTFLRKELSKCFGDETVEKAIEFNPAKAGISVDELEQIAKACIDYETRKVSAISAVAGLPGGFAMAATIPADAVQLFAHIIRVLQKLAYLYGWQEFYREKDTDFDDETSNKIILFIGAMMGVNVANTALAKISVLMAQNTSKHLARKALTKGVVYPVVKKTLGMIGVKMTKKIFAKSVGKIIPVVGAVASGGVTYVIFKPMAKRLKKYLETLSLASVEHYKTIENNDLV